MDDMNGLLRKVVRITSVFLSLCLLLWAFFPEWRPIFAGLAIGGAASVVNAIFLSAKVRRIGDFAQGAGRKTGIGFWTRAAVALLAVIVALRVPGIHLYGVVAGLFFAQLVTLILGIISKEQH